MTDEAKLYVVRNDDGEYLMDPAFAAWFPGWTDDITTADMYEHKEAAEETANECDGHVVELLEAPAKVVVSEEEAEILKKLDREIRTKSTGYSPWKWLSKLDDLGMAVEDAYKALAIGWTVEKPKRWNVKVPHSRFYYWKWKDDAIGVGSGEDDDVRGVEPYRFTDAEVERYGLQDCEKEEVTDDGMGC
ncbi:DUF1642 domain-containing protein [Lacticaseibacillus sp. 53-4]|uniref:DUF1642 domain-containing protein n=1 Tax=Lacticaseibacillus sp. 53-4 TaxID=2799575 RepID=UPI001944E99B|nr:DUF1642 domain-containing protein [Lacticaseibacillus sp. 53-4]